MATVVDPDNKATTGTSQNQMIDLSGVETLACDNPYDALIARANETDNPPQVIQQAYETHRSTRNAMKKAEIILPDFEGVVPDHYLSNRLQDEEYVDPRNSLVFWARPPKEVLTLATKLQAIIKEVMPSMWLMPPEDMHTTVLEVVHSVTIKKVMQLANDLGPIIDELTALPKAGYGCMLVKPMVSFDAAAIALSFVPCGETSPSTHEPPKPGYGSERSPCQTSLKLSARSSISSTPSPPSPGSATTKGTTHSIPQTIADFTEAALRVSSGHINQSNHQLHSQSLPGSMHPPSQTALPIHPTQSSAYPPAMQPPTPGSLSDPSASPSNAFPTACPPDLPSMQPISSPSHVESPHSTLHSQKTYHHLRSALHARITAYGAPIESRYVVPSAHITLARYVTSSASSAYNTDLRKSEDELTHKNLVCLIQTIELINAYLSLSGKEDSLSSLAAFERIEIQAREVLNIDNNSNSAPLIASSLRNLETRSQLSEMGKAKWDVEDELVCRVGDLWYGGGFTVKSPQKERGR